MEKGQWMPATISASSSSEVSFSSDYGKVSQRFSPLCLRMWTCKLEYDNSTVFAHLWQAS